VSPTPEINKGQPPSFNSSPAVRLEPAGCVPDEKNWSEVSKESSLKMSHSFTPVVEQLYQDDVRKQGPLFEPSVSSAVYFLVHTAPQQTTPLEVLIYKSPDDKNPSVVPMTRLEDGRQFVGIDDGGKTIGEGTRFAYRNPQTGALIADPYAYQLSQFEWTKIPGLDEMPNQTHFKLIQCTVRQDPLVSAIRARGGRDIAPAPDYDDIRTVKFHTLRTSDLTDEQLGAGFEGTQGTLKALQSPFVQRELLKGFNQIEFFPIHSCGTGVPTFYEDGPLNPDARDVWGYMPISHFSIDPSRVHNKDNPWAEVIETIDSLHRAGLRVAVDVVPHSLEEKGPKLNLGILDRDGYYATYDDGRLRNYSGCGNAIRFVPTPGRNYELNSLESQVGVGGAYFFRSIENLFRLGADVRIDQGIMIGRNEWGDFSPDAKAFSLLSQLANTHGSRVVCESSDCGKDGPGSSDWIRIEPYAPTAPVHPDSKLRTIDFATREITRNAMADFMGMMRGVANVLNGNGLCYARGGDLADAYRAVVAPHDGYPKYSDMKERLNRSSFRDRYFWNADQTLLTESERQLTPDEREKLIEQRIVSSAVLGDEFLITFSPATRRAWNYGEQFLADQMGNHNAYDRPEFSNRSYTTVESWRDEYRKVWLKKEELREELGIFSHSRFLGHPSLQYFDGSGQCMNRGYDHEVNARWSSGHVLSAWYSGEQFDKSDVLVTWCSQPRKRKYDTVNTNNSEDSEKQKADNASPGIEKTGHLPNPAPEGSETQKATSPLLGFEDAVHLPNPGVSETGERYVWLRRADSSTLVTPGDKSDIFEPMIVNQSEGVFFQTGGVQVFQRLTEREAINHIKRYWQERCQA